MSAPVASGGRALGLDHAAVAGRDLAALAAAFEWLGFCVTPLARHASGRTGNRNIMLRHGYIELMSVMDGGSSATLDRFLARYAGIHIVSLAVDDPAAALSRLRRAGVAEVMLSDTERAVDDADPSRGRARFTLVTAPDLPEGRIDLIRHLTPAALWQDRFLHHPNHAVALEAVVIATDNPAAAAARLSLLAGRPVVPDPGGGYALELLHGRVRILPPDAIGAVFPRASVPPVPCVAGIVVRTDDANRALRRCLRDWPIPFAEEGRAVLAEAGGAWLRFEAE